MATVDITELQTAQVSLTEGAVARVQALLQERELEGYALRVFISGGGCSGMQYGMALEGEPRESDHRFAFGGVNVVVDPMSMNYLSGAVIDYVDDLMGGGFRIENPQAVSSCGCGHSFRTADSAEGHSEHGGSCC
ncbi:MAG TPA: iron-sulfur cluster insertion protein ErpA [Anaerolineales bacterium]|jgi:iron-sulfur cluster assembly accessory protein|nr:iron-sulfur cluster insertion protein ErpA [Anaerolineales bacterium]